MGRCSTAASIPCQMQAVRGTQLGHLETATLAQNKQKARLGTLRLPDWHRVEACRTI